MARPVAAMVGISIVGMLIALDQTVVGTALPRMMADLKGFELYPWVAASYLLATAILIPVTGRLGDLHGRKPYLLGSIALFILASALCGVAETMLQLVLARGLQGIGGGMLLGTTFAAVTDIFPDTLERVRWHVMLSAAFGSASAFGPVLGGWMTVHFGWRSVFFINLPLGLVALFIVWRFLPTVDAEKSEGKAIDWSGLLLLTLSIGTLLLTLEFAERLGFASLKFLSAVVLSIALAVVFVHHQRRSSAPIIPLVLFSSPVVRRLSILAMLTGFCLFVLVFYAPLMLQAGFSLSPGEAGLLVTPIMVCVTLGSIINGRLIPRMKKPERLFSLGGLVLMPTMAMLCLVSSETPHLLLLGLFALCGFAFGFQLPNLTIQMQASVERKHIGAASALIQTLRTVGSMFGASLAGLVVSAVFTRGATVVLAKGGINQPEVQQLLETPQVLLRTGEQEILSQMGTRFGFDAATLVEQARLALVHGIRGAFLICLLLAVVSYYLGRKLPPFMHQGRA